MDTNAGHAFSTRTGSFALSPLLFTPHTAVPVYASFVSTWCSPFLYHRFPRLLMPHPFNSRQISFSPLPRSELSNISRTIGAADGSTCSVGRSFTPSLTFTRLYPNGARHAKK